MLYRLIYKSRSAGALRKTDLRDILYTSLENNRADGVNGALLATQTHFLQFMEGGFDEVNETFFRITKDPRHLEIKLVSFGPVEEALFSQWRMKGFGVFDLNVDLEKKLKDHYGDEDGGVFLPIDEKSALSLLNEIGFLEPAV